MKLKNRIERKLLQLRCGRIYRRSDIGRKRKLAHKGILTVYHDYERNYHDESVSQHSDHGIRRILETEKSYGIRATYNVVAKLMDEVRPIIRGIRENGHEMASHSYCHSILSTLPTDRIEKDVKATKKIFEKHNLELTGLRSPQSRWSFRQLPIMANCNMMWSAENDRADFPYVIYENGGRRLFRMPIKMDDWDYEEKNISPDAMHKKLTECANRLAENKVYGAVGFHPWVLGKNEDRLKIFDDFIEYIAKHDGIMTLTFRQACDFFWN